MDVPSLSSVPIVADGCADAVEVLHGLPVDVRLKLGAGQLLAGETPGVEVVQLSVVGILEALSPTHGDELSVDVGQVTRDDLDNGPVGVAIERHGFTADNLGEVRAIGRGVGLDAEEVQHLAELGAKAAPVLQRPRERDHALVQHRAQLAEEVVELLQLLAEILRDQVIQRELQTLGDRAGGDHRPHGFEHGAVADRLLQTVRHQVQVGCRVHTAGRVEDSAEVRLLSGERLHHLVGCRRRDGGDVFQLRDLGDELRSHGRHGHVVLDLLPVEVLLDGGLEAVDLGQRLGVRHDGAAQGIADGDAGAEVSATELGGSHTCGGSGTGRRTVTQLGCHSLHAAGGAHRSSRCCYRRRRPRAFVYSRTLSVGGIATNPVQERIVERALVEAHGGVQSGVFLGLGLVKVAGLQLLLGVVEPLME